MDNSRHIPGAKTMITPNKALALAIVTLGVAPLYGCRPVKTFSDQIRYSAPQHGLERYKRVAVVYFGAKQEDPKAHDDPLADAETGLSDFSASQGVDSVIFSNSLIAALSDAGVDVVDRTKIDDLMREQGLSISELIDISDTERLQRIGRLLRADLVISGTIFALDGGMNRSKATLGWNRNVEKDDLSYERQVGVSIRGVDTSTGKVVWLSTLMVAKFVPHRLVLKGERADDVSFVREIMTKLVSDFSA